MQISINVGSANDDDKPQSKSIFKEIKAFVCQASLKSVVTIIVFFIVLVFFCYACKAYTADLLVWLEGQEAVIIYLVIIILFILVSFPISVGYIFIVISAGYLFGTALGLILTIIGANVGLIIAHHTLKVIGHHSSIRSLVTSEVGSAIFKVISGPSSFKIVFCARLTPIPFGLQNSIFALSNISGEVYHVASLLGLIPGQVVGIYVGSSLRSMQDVLEKPQFSNFTYVFGAGQLLFAIGLLIWLGFKARLELARAIAEADSKFGMGDSRFVFNL